uniref:Deoxyribonuclease II n=1 Tax=Syphacia muris TaxID=451379 RepID=A0A0N5AHC8_9BILA
MVKHNILAQVLFFSYCLHLSDSSITCRNRFGLPVDWFVAYKLPKPAGEAECSGTELLYADNAADNWQSPEDIKSMQSSVALTLSQYYKSLNDSTTFYMLYNDENPGADRSDNSHGHAKGAIVFDKRSGFLLIHSVPHFPPPNTYEYPISGLRNGQSFLCITFAAEELNTLAVQMHYTQPSIYQSQLPVYFATRYPLLQKVIAMQRFQRKIKVFSSVKHLKSLSGIPFLSFAKYKEYRKDLYADFVAPAIKQTLFVETWLNGPGDLSSSCNTAYKVMNVLSIRLQNFTFPSSKDHSKWAISNDDNEPYLCIGDINRQVSQTMRSGGTMCFQNKNLWKVFKKSIIKVEPCKTAKVISFWKNIKKLYGS